MGEFLENIVNKRFREVYEHLLETGLAKGKSHIAKQLGTYNHIINSILKGERNITLEQLNKLFEYYDINPAYLFGKSDVMIVGRKVANARSNITLVTEKALAGYALSHNNHQYLELLQKFSVPGLEGELIAFEISGDSMMPTIMNGDIVICEGLERGEPLRDNAVYVIVTDVVVTKRIQQIRTNNGVLELQLISDNVIYKPYNLELQEVKQLLKVKSRLTSYGIG